MKTQSSLYLRIVKTFTDEFFFVRNSYSIIPEFRDKREGVYALIEIYLRKELTLQEIRNCFMILSGDERVPYIHSASPHKKLQDIAIWNKVSEDFLRLGSVIEMYEFSVGDNCFWVCKKYKPLVSWGIIFIQPLQIHILEDGSYDWECFYSNPFYSIKNCEAMLNNYLDEQLLGVDRFNTILNQIHSIKDDIPENVILFN